MRAPSSGELKKFSKQLAAKPRWLVINKADLLPQAEAQKKARAIVRALRHRGPHFLISGATGAGTQELCQAVMGFLEEHERKAREETANADAAPAKEEDES